MVASDNSENKNPKKEKKKKKNGGKSKEKSETSKQSTSQKETSSSSSSSVAPDILSKNLFREKSKTLTDFRRKPKVTNSDTNPTPFEWSQSSFRRRINTFIQNSPLLRRSTYTKHTPNLKNDLNRLSDSLESLKIDEGRILTTTTTITPTAATATELPRSSHPDSKRKHFKKSRSVSCNEFNFDFRPDSKCVSCMNSDNSKDSRVMKGGSLWNLPLSGDKNQTGGIMKRSLSLHLSARPWTWISGSSRLINPISRNDSNRNDVKAKSPDQEFCTQCGLPLVLLRNGHLTSKVRSRSLTHIDQIEQSQPGVIFLKEMNSAEKTSEQLAVPTNISKHRRQMLSRSEASSSECFTVGIEGLGDDGNDEFVQASKNTILRDALLDVCKRRGIDLASSNVFLDANKSPLPCLDIDTSWMGGKHIRIKVNDRVTAVKKDQKTSFGGPIPLKKISSNYKGTKSGSRTHNVSSEEPSSIEPGPSGKSSKRWSGFFGTSRDTSKMETLIDLLDSYTKNGIYEYNEDIYKLEPDWKSIVTSAANLEDRHSQQQEAIWELLRSEIDYIKMLRVVSHLFIACLVNLQSNQLLLEIDNKKLFGNVEEIYSCNDLFWRKYLMPVVEASRKTGEPLNPELLKDGFMDFPNIFKCYETYCTQQSRCQHYCREKLQQDQENELFTAYLAWCETQKECNRLKLLDILVKPMQRLTKYSLLLKAILKHTTNSNHRDIILNMVKSVDSFVNNVNSTLKQNQDLETMKQLMSKIESYDVIESKDDDLSSLIQKYSHLNLTYDIPGTSHKRSLLFESDVKYKDASTSSKIEVHAFLFTDFLLITKPVKRLGESKVKFKIIRQPFVIDRLITQEIARDPPSLACVYLSIYKTACTAFMLTCSETELKNWSDAIKKAKSLYTSLKSLQGHPAAQTPTTLPMSRQPSGYTNEDASIGDNMEENKGMTYNLGLWAGRSPRGSSCGSRISSLVHSHSGSMEMTENISSISSVSASRGVSVENNSEVRGSSLSSDDGNTNQGTSPRVELTTSPRIERRDTPPVPERRESPVLHRPESKSLYRKSATKSENTLTIQVPHLGQSLPNLNIASSPGGPSSPNPCPPNTLLLAPPKSHGGLLSPSQRGVSYPPPSPPRGSLKRGFAIAPRNPPLVKSGHVSMELTRTASVGQPSSDVVEKSNEEKKSKTVGLQTNLDENSSKSEPKTTETKCSQCVCSTRGNFLKANGKKLMRSDKRYHTAGTIDDLKTKKDSSIHKRLSFNSGNEKTGTTNETIEPVPINKHLSIASVQSSSGFSSAGSSVEGLFTKEDNTNETKPFKFEEILHIINLEDGGGGNSGDNESKQQTEPQSDLERFDSKVSKWRKYGFDESKLENPGGIDFSSFNLGLHSTNLSLSSAKNLSKSTGKSSKVPSPKKVFSVVESLTASLIALQLENILRLPSHKLPGVERKKRKRRATL